MPCVEVYGGWIIAKLIRPTQSPNDVNSLLNKYLMIPSKLHIGPVIITDSPCMALTIFPFTVGETRRSMIRFEANVRLT